MNQKTEKTRLIQEALTLPLAERAQFVTQIADTETRVAVEAALADLAATSPGGPASESTNELRPGDKIKRIVIESLIGKGGMGSVYLGFDEKLERQVAVKSIRPEYLQIQSTHERFVREAQLLSKINHPAICQIYDYLETEQGDYLVLEYIRGKQLYQEGLDDAVTLTVLIELAQALASAHAHGIVHRDLKPDNIMITEAGQVKVLDFGIARSISQATKSSPKPDVATDSSLTQQGSLVGTIRYMSPEQARGDLITTASDIFSLGLIAQELFSRQPAYEVLETDQLLQDVKTGQRADISGLDSDQRELLDQMLAEQPDRRPTAGEVVAQLQEIQAKPLKLKQKRRRIAVVVLLVLFFGAITGYFLHQKNSRELEASYVAEVNDLVRQSEQIYVLPIHDVQPGINALLMKGGQLFQQISQDLGLSKPAKDRLLGLIYLEAEEFEAAIPLLEAGAADAEWLARAWVGQYIDEMTAHSEIHGVSSALAADSIHQKYRATAINYIHASENPDPVLVAFEMTQTDSMPAAVAHLDTVINDQQWNNKAVKLKAQILMALATQAMEDGAWAEARAHYLETAKTYQQAIEMARSYPDNYASLCAVRGLLMTDGVLRTGEDVESHGAEAIQACEDFLRTYPNTQGVMTDLARIHIMLAQWKLQTGHSPDAHLQQANHWNGLAGEIEAHWGVWWVDAMIHSVTAMAQVQNGEDPMLSLQQAHEQYAKTIEMTTNAFAFADRLYVQAMVAQHQLNQGSVDPALFEEARGWFLQAMLLDAGLTSNKKHRLYSNLSAVLLMDLLAKLHFGEDIQSDGKALLALLDEVDHEWIDEPIILVNRSLTHSLMAEQRIGRGENADELLSDAQDAINQAVQINATHPLVLSMQARLMSLRAATGNADFAAVNQAFVLAVDKNPLLAETHHAWAQSRWHEARVTVDPGEWLVVIQAGLIAVDMALMLAPGSVRFVDTKNKLLALQPNH